MNLFFAKSPANIALIKYWGIDSQSPKWPCNSSLSMTLTECFTVTGVGQIKYRSDYANSDPGDNLQILCSNQIRRLVIDFLQSSNNHLIKKVCSHLSTQNLDFTTQPIIVKFSYAAIRSDNYRYLSQEKPSYGPSIDHIIYLDFFSDDHCSDYNIKFNFSIDNRISPPSLSFVCIGKIDLDGVNSLGDFKRKSSNDYLTMTRIAKHLNYLRSTMNLDNSDCVIITGSSFPTNCGVASSASGFSALTLGFLASYYNASSMSELDKNALTKEKIAYLSGQGSGSAGRSIWGGYVSWNKDLSADSQYYIQEFEDSSLQLIDIIIIVNKDDKKLKSSIGHLHAHSSKYFSARIANNRIENMLAVFICAIKDKRWKLLGNLVESESKEMHKIIRTQQGGCDYLDSKSKSIINWVENFRLTSKIKLYYTVDAGPNIHLLCKPSSLNIVLNSLKREFFDCQMIIDKTGKFGAIIDQVVEFNLK